MTEKNKMQEIIANIVAKIYSIGKPIVLNDKDLNSLKSIKNDSEELQKLIEELNENCLPRPVTRDKSGKLIADHMPRDFYLKLQEEIFEVMEVSQKMIFAKRSSFYTERQVAKLEDYLSEEIADIITVCVSQLEALGYDEEKRSEIFQKVNKKNEKRGYFEERNK